LESSETSESLQDRPAAESTGNPRSGVWLNSEDIDARRIG
jgi:hypothetical protein